MYTKHFILMLAVMLMLSWNSLYAQQRFYHKPVTLEARATQIDVQNPQEMNLEIPVLDELGNPVELRTIDANDLDHKELENQMYLWRVRTKYWGKQDSMEYLYSFTNRTI